MRLFVNIKNIPVWNSEPFVDSQGVQYPPSYPKNSIADLSEVTTTDAPVVADDKVVSHFDVVDLIQVWVVRDKTKEELIEWLEYAVEIQARKAKELLAKTDVVSARCFQAGVPFGDAWRDYSSALRVLVRAKSILDFPEKPKEYPDGT